MVLDDNNLMAFENDEGLREGGENKVETCTNTEKSETYALDENENNDLADTIGQLQSTIGNKALLNMINEDPEFAESLIKTDPKYPQEFVAEMRYKLGIDINDLNINYNDSRADDFEAEAYTIGNNINIAKSSLDFDNRGDRELFLHETGHVIQQSEGRVQAETEENGVAINRDDAFESEADELARNFSGFSIANIMKRVLTNINSDIAQFSPEYLKIIQEKLKDISIKKKEERKSKLKDLRIYVQKRFLTQSELTVVSTNLIGVGLKEEYITALRRMNFGRFLTRVKGSSPKAMKRAHAHHILFKKGNGKVQRKLVKEGQDILLKYGIDPVAGEENLVWAPNGVSGQHDISALKNVVDQLRAVDTQIGTKEAIVLKLKELGDLASRR